MLLVKTDGQERVCIELQTAEVEEHGARKGQLLLQQLGGLVEKIDDRGCLSRLRLGQVVVEGCRRNL